MSTSDGEFLANNNVELYVMIDIMQTTEKKNMGKGTEPEYAYIQSAL